MAIEGAYAEYIGPERMMLKIPYTFEKSEETLIRAATDCRVILLNYVKAQGSINLITGVDFTPGVAYARTHSEQKMVGTGSHRRMKTFNYYDKLTLLKIEGNRVEYGVLSTVNGTSVQWSMVIIVGQGRSPGGSPIVEIQHLNKGTPTNVPCCCFCLKGCILNCIRDAHVAELRAQGIFYQDFFNTYQEVGGDHGASALTQQPVQQYQTSSAPIPISAPIGVTTVDDDGEDSLVKRF